MRWTFQSGRVRRAQLPAQAHPGGRGRISQGELLHDNHFVCTDCNAPLNVKYYYVHEGKRYCDRDFARRAKVGRAASPVRLIDAT
jgi:hypothetical protein